SMWETNPIVGLGIQGFDRNIGHHLVAYFETGRDFTEIRILQKTSYVFNDFLQILIEYGLIGFSIVICIFYYIFSGHWTKDLLGIYYKSTLIALICGSLTSYPIQVFSMWMLIVLLLAM